MSEEKERVLYTQKGDTLYVGGDDSNHAGDSRGEIIVATFSSISEDSFVRSFSNYRDYHSLSKWLSSPHRDYLFGVLVSEKYRHSHSNLVHAVPILISNFLAENDLRIKTLKIYLDGRLDTGVREFFKEKFRKIHGIETVVVDNFIKKNKSCRGVSKRPYCPAVVYHADILAHDLFTKAFNGLSTHKKNRSIN